MDTQNKNGRSAVSEKRSAKGFAAGFIKGLTAGGIMMAGLMAGPKAPATDMASDWDAIGGDVRTAIGKYAARRG
jgi:hypothetical protein